MNMRDTRQKCRCLHVGSQCRLMAPHLLPIEHIQGVARGICPSQCRFHGSLTQTQQPADGPFGINAAAASQTIGQHRIMGLAPMQ